MRIAAFYKFIREREAIRLKKGAGYERPWTQDPVLQKYKFTNVKREHDWTTQRLIESFYGQQCAEVASPEEILINAAVFRYFGRYEFAQAVGWQEEYDPEHTRDTARAMLNDGKKAFTGAYMITNMGLTGPKEDVVSHFLTGLVEEAEMICHEAILESSWRVLITSMRNILGFGGSGFMAKEIVLDTMFTPFWGTKDGKPEDFNDWCPVGPGARRGLNRLTGRDLNKPVPEPAMILEMAKIFEQREKYWPEDYVTLELHDIQFQLCEFDKYERVLNGEGAPRSLYRPRY